MCSLKSILTVFLFALVASTAVGGRDIIARLWTDFREEESFIRLSDYFNGEEGPGNFVWLRSQADAREGFYFTIRLKRSSDVPLQPGIVRLHLIAPDAETAESYEFPFSPASPRTTRLELGLTGDDWPHGDVLPLAWRLEILDPNGEIVAARNSFLWENP